MSLGYRNPDKNYNSLLSKMSEAKSFPVNYGKNRYTILESKKKTEHNNILDPESAEKLLKELKVEWDGVEDYGGGKVYTLKDEIVAEYSTEHANISVYQELESSLPKAETTPTETEHDHVTDTNASESRKTDIEKQLSNYREALKQHKKSKNKKSEEEVASKIQELEKERSQLSNESVSEASKEHKCPKCGKEMAHSTLTGEDYYWCPTHGKKPAKESVLKESGESINKLIPFALKTVIQNYLSQKGIKITVGNPIESISWAYYSWSASGVHEGEKITSISLGEQGLSVTGPNNSWIVEKKEEIEKRAKESNICAECGFRVAGEGIKHTIRHFNGKKETLNLCKNCYTQVYKKNNEGRTSKYQDKAKESVFGGSAYSMSASSSSDQKKYQPAARGISDKDTADQFAQEEGGVVSNDDQEKDKFMVIKTQESIAEKHPNEGIEWPKEMRDQDADDVNDQLIHDDEEEKYADFLAKLRSKKVKESAHDVQCPKCKQMIDHVVNGRCPKCKFQIQKSRYTDESISESEIDSAKKKIEDLKAKIPTLKGKEKSTAERDLKSEESYVRWLQSQKESVSEKSNTYDLEVKLSSLKDKLTKTRHEDEDSNGEKIFPKIQKQITDVITKIKKAKESVNEVNFRPWKRHEPFGPRISICVRVNKKSIDIFDSIIKLSKAFGFYIDPNNTAKNSLWDSGNGVIMVDCDDRGKADQFIAEIEQAHGNKVSVTYARDKNESVNEASRHVWHCNKCSHTQKIGFGGFNASYDSKPCPKCFKTRRGMMKPVAKEYLGVKESVNEKWKITLHKNNSSQRKTVVVDTSDFKKAMAQAEKDNPGWVTTDSKRVNEDCVIKPGETYEFSDGEQVDIDSVIGTTINMTTRDGKEQSMQYQEFDHMLHAKQVVKVGEAKNLDELAEKAVIINNLLLKETLTEKEKAFVNENIKVELTESERKIVKRIAYEKYGHLVKTKGTSNETTAK